MRVLILGSAGYLGQVLYPILTEDHEVLGLDNLLYNQRVSFSWLRGDITSLTDMYKATKGQNVVVALAGIVGDPACGLDEEATRIINQESTKMLVDVCEANKVKKIIFASTCSVYGDSQGTSDEYSPVNPLSLYSQTKLKSEKILFERCQSCRPVILRFGTLFGYSPRMRFDLVVNIMTAMAMKEKKVIINGGDQWRPLLHVRDAARVIKHFIETEPNSLIYNVAQGNYAIREIGEKVASLTGVKLIDKENNKDKRNYIAVSVKLDFPLQISLEEGIKEIKKHFEGGEFNNYKDDKFYNVKILETLRTEIR